MLGSDAQAALKYQFVPIAPSNACAPSMALNGPSSPQVRFVHTVALDLTSPIQAINRTELLLSNDKIHMSLKVGLKLGPVRPENFLVNSQFKAAIINIKGLKRKMHQSNCWFYA